MYFFEHENAKLCAIRRKNQASFTKLKSKGFFGQLCAQYISIKFCLIKIVDLGWNPLLNFLENRLLNSSHSLTAEQQSQHPSIVKILLLFCYSYFISLLYVPILFSYLRVQTYLESLLQKNLTSYLTSYLTQNEVLNAQKQTPASTDLEPQVSRTINLNCDVRSPEIPTSPSIFVPSSINFKRTNSETNLSEDSENFNLTRTNSKESLLPP